MEYVKYCAHKRQLNLWRAIKMAKKDYTHTYTIVFAGVGGQGNISAIIILGEALIQKGFAVHSSETHGLGQRGGKVQTILRFCEQDIAPIPTLGTADLIVATEKSAVLDVLKFANPDKKTKIVIDSYKNEIVEVEYPDDEYIDRCLQENSDELYIIPATNIAETKVGNIKTANTVIIGYLLKFIPLNPEDLKKSLEQRYKGKILELNIRALEEGINFR